MTDRDEEESGNRQRDTLEQRLARLDEIVAALEADDLELDQALKMFEEGIAHVRAAEKALTETELRVEELLDQSGVQEVEDAEAEAE